ncbi:MAG: hypothetical protein KGH91_00255 [Rhodospirillales bacterium]|nr:hypothetical protein [Rhodospirillales bacterium]
MGVFALINRLRFREINERTSGQAKDTDRAFLVVGLMLIAALWLATRQYFGIIADSRFYTVQALSALLPSRFANDLYFQYGSQDQFTIFTKIYTPFISVFGLAYGNLIPTLLAEFLWLCGAAFLFHSLTWNLRTSFSAFASLIILPGSFVFLSYGEPFLTPRLVTEALIFGALGCMLRGWVLNACAIFLVSVFVHPLMTLPGLSVFFLYETLKRPWLLSVALIGICLGIGLAILNIQPFSRLLVSFDPIWLHITEVRDGFAFVLKWTFISKIQALNIFSLAGLTLLFLKGQERLFLALAMIVAFLGILVTFIGGDLLHNILIVNIQACRALILLAAVTNLFLGKILISPDEDTPRGQSRFVLLLSIAALALSRFFVDYILFVLPLCSLGFVLLAIERTACKPASKIGYLLIIVYLSVILALTPIALRASFANTLAISSGIWPWLASLFVSASALAALYILGRYPTRTVPRFLVYGSTLLLIISITNWDQRSPWIKFVDNASPPADLVAALPANAPIYWEGDVTVPWFLLKRTSQLSCGQGTGVMFFRNTAIAYQARYQIFARLGALDFGRDQFCPAPKLSSPPAVDLKNLAYVCRNQTGLGALVLTTLAPDAPHHVWTAPVPFQYTRQVDGKPVQVKTNKFYIYRCNELLHLPAS